MPEGLGLRVLVADDERPARAKVRRFLADDPDVAVIHEAWDVPTTLAVIREAGPDLVFLDIEMPGGSGIDVLEALPPGAAPHVIFVTAHDTFAVRAFDLAAVDYLLKPFDERRFARALARVKTVIAARERAADARRLARLLAELGGPGPDRLERILVAEGQRRRVVRLDEVDRIDAERNYVRLHAGKESWRARGTLAELEARLDPDRFVRVGRGTLVQLDRILHLEPAGHGDFILVLRDGTPVRLSRRYAERVAARIG